MNFKDFALSYINKVRDINPVEPDRVPKKKCCD